jgi:CubicO group peptidase (beta-lactamase class C family)
MSVEIHGFCDERFQPLKEAFAANFEDGQEVGASIALLVRGEPLVDLWAGWADRSRTRRWERDTLAPVTSTSKVVAALSLLMLIDRRRVELNAPVAIYWPAFAQGGKAQVTVRDVLTHQAGVPAFDPPITGSLARDWEAVTARLAAEPHWFGGERRLMYHGATFGLIAGELVRRVDGRPLPRFFFEEAARPAGIDFHFGVADLAEPYRLAEPVDFRAPGAGAEPPPGLLRRWVASVRGAADVPAWETLNYSINGLGNGRSLARFGAIFAASGALDGVRYLSGALAAEACREQASGVCPYLGSASFGLGFGLNSRGFRYPSTDGCGWGGAGGSRVILDPKLGYSFGYTPNKMDEDALRDHRVAHINDALAAVVAEL